MIARIRASHWPLTIALALGVFSVGTMLSVAVPTPVEPQETLKAWTLEDALMQCHSLPSKHIQGCIDAAYATDWK